MKNKKILICLLIFTLTLPLFGSEPLAPLFRKCVHSEQNSFNMNLGYISTSILKIFSKEFRESGIKTISITIFEDADEINNNIFLKKLKKQSSFSDFPLLTLIKDKDCLIKIFGKEDKGYLKNLYLTIFDDNKNIILLHIKGKIKTENISKIITTTKDKYGH